MNSLTKASFCILALFVCILSARAGEQPEPGPWKVDVSTGIVTTQSSYSDNWTGGEAGSVNWVAFYNSMTKRQITRNWYNQYDWKLAFGQTHVQNTDSVNDKYWETPKKSEDKIRFDALLKLTKGWFADPYFALTAETQFWDARSKQNPRYLNPLVLTESSGLARTIYEVPDRALFTSRLGVGLRQQWESKDDTSQVDLPTISTNSLDGGVEWVTDLLLSSAASKYSFNSKLTVFNALFNSKEDELPNDYWKTADANWDNYLRVKVSSLINVGLNWQLLYDKEVDLGGRLKQALSVGLVYNWANFDKDAEKK